jgi:hypothetical protein
MQGNARKCIVASSEWNIILQCWKDSLRWWFPFFDMMWSILSGRLDWNPGFIQCCNVANNFVPFSPFKGFLGERKLGSENHCLRSQWKPLLTLIKDEKATLVPSTVKLLYQQKKKALSERCYKSVNVCCKLLSSLERLERSPHYLRIIKNTLLMINIIKHFRKQPWQVRAARETTEQQQKCESGGLSVCALTCAYPPWSQPLYY